MNQTVLINRIFYTIPHYALVLMVLYSGSSTTMKESSKEVEKTENIEEVPHHFYCSGRFLWEIAKRPLDKQKKANPTFCKVSGITMGQYFYKSDFNIDHMYISSYLDTNA